MAWILAAIAFARAKWLHGWIFTSIGLLLYVAGVTLQDLPARNGLPGGVEDDRHKAESAGTSFGPSAEWIMDAALATAKLQDKRVLVCFGGPTCRWCLVLAQFLNSEAQLFKGDYVIALIDPHEMKLGYTVQRRLRKDRLYRDPWMVILDADGRELISSDGPNGNIGYPSRPDEIDYFLTMIEKTKKRMSAQQIGGIKQALEDNAATLRR